MNSKKTMRMTRQRQVILDVLRKADSHPTAAEVFDDVRKTLPHISLGTVYRNLETLATRGVIQKLEDVGPQKRFDGKMEDHHHIQCVSCGKIKDVTVATQELKNRIKRPLEKKSGFMVTGLRIAFKGICPHCK